MFTSPQFYDYNNDNINDIIIGGRDAELRLINGLNGETIWEFWGDENLNPNDYGWYNFYTSQVIDDQNSDTYPDILVSNGGDHSLDFSVLDRPPGHIMIIDGITGLSIKTAVVPDSNETYMSPLLVDLNGDGNKTLIFGTGGEEIVRFNSSSTELIRNSGPVDASTQQEFGIGIAVNANHTHPAAKITFKEFDASDSRGDLLFYTRETNNDVASTEKLRITSAGNVVINSPTLSLIHI